MVGKAAIPVVMPSARDRVLACAYELFTRRGIRAVGVDDVVAAAHVSRATFYRHFPSKDDLVLAVLAERERRWTYGAIERGARSRGDTPEQQLLAIFDVFDDWFARVDFEACSFINVLLEMGHEHPLGRASIGYLEHIRSMVEQLAHEAGLRDTDEFAHSWHILMKGSIISATEGDRAAAKRARAMAGSLIAAHRPNASRARRAGSLPSMPG